MHTYKISSQVKQSSGKKTTKNIKISLPLSNLAVRYFGIIFRVQANNICLIRSNHTQGQNQLTLKGAVDMYNVLALLHILM